MRKILFTALFVFFCTSLALAQDDYNKFEVSGSFSSLRAKTAALSLVDNVGNINLVEGENRRFNGFDVSATYNFSRYVGAKFDVSGHFASYDAVVPGTNLVRTSGTGASLIAIPASSTTAEHRLYNFLGGVQL